MVENWSKLDLNKNRFSYGSYDKIINSIKRHSTENPCMTKKKEIETTMQNMYNPLKLVSF